MQYLKYTNNSCTDTTHNSSNTHRIKQIKDVWELSIGGNNKIIRWTYKNGKMGADQSPSTEMVLNIHNIPHGKQFMIISPAKAIHIK